jgi:tRNA (cytidine/uridine-2'-O-)-methyltransferase
VAAALGGNHLWLFSTKAVRSYASVVYQPGDALVFGPESRGLPGHWLDACAERVLRIPMRAEARSLNLSCAVAIGVYEAVRQFGTAECSTDGP